MWKKNTICAFEHLATETYHAGQLLRLPSNRTDILICFSEELADAISFE